VGGIDPATVGVVLLVRVLEVEVLVPVLPTPTPPEPEPDPPVAVVIGPPGLTVAEDELDEVVELEDWVTVSVIVGVAVVVAAVDDCVVRVVPVESVVVEPEPEPHAARATHARPTPTGAAKNVVTRRSDRTGS
jgi:hypothetical protein